MITKYNDYIKESLRDKMIPKSQEDIKKNFSRLSKKKKNQFLFKSVWSADEESVKLALEMGADAKSGPKRETPIIVQATGGSVPRYNIIKNLLEYGADPLSTDLAGRSMISILDGRGLEDIIELIKSYIK